MKVLIFFIAIVLNFKAGFTQNMPASAKSQQIAEIGSFKLESGQMINQCKIGYRVHGKLNNAKTNAVVYLTWFGGNSEGIEANSPWHSVDTTKYFLIIIDALGNGVSSSPSNSVTQHGTKFPKISIADMVNSQYQLLNESFKIKHIRAVMGVSMGGIQTFQWGVSYPNYMDVLIPIVGSPKPTGYDLMLYHTFMEILDESPAYNHGNYSTNPKIAELNMFWDLFLTTPAERVKSMVNIKIQQWIDQQKNAVHPDWNDSRAQMSAVIDHDIIKKYNNSIKEAAAQIKARMLIVTSLQDHMVNPAPAIEFSKLLPAKLVVINDERGHMAPGGNQQVENSVRDILKDTEHN